MPTLPDGRQVDTASPEWRAECLRQWQARQPEVDRHVATLQRIRSRQERADYIATLSANDAGFAERVRAEFIKAWEKKC